MDAGEWPFYKLCWVPVGQGEIEFKNKRATLQGGDLIWIPAHAPHRFIDEPKDAMSLVIACITTKLIDARPELGETVELIENRLGSGQPMRAINQYYYREIRDAYKRLLSEQDKQLPALQTAMHAALNYLLVVITRGCSHEAQSGPRRQRDMEGVLRYMELNFDHPIQLADLAERCRLSTRRFTDIFKTHTGKTVVEYLNEKRIEYAKERLRQTGHILYASNEAGFQDVAYFYRIFKKHTGVTPGEFIQKHS